MTRCKKFGCDMIIFSALVVVVFIAVFLMWHDRDTIRAATREAHDYYTLNLHYRSWNASIGGVYASIDKVAPNPYLELPQRDVTLTDGRQLTLINPAYMTRMVFERSSSDPDQAIFNKLVSLNPINPANAANAWESEALRRMEKNPVANFTQLGDVDGEEFLQFLGPFVTEQSCLKCHERQGYRIGDLRGAVSISIPMAKYRATQASLNQRFIITLLLLWGSFSGLWAFLSKHRYDKELALQRSEERNRTIFETSQAGIFMVDPQGTITVANRSMAEMFGSTLDQLIGIKYPELIAPEERAVGDRRMLQLIRGEIPGVSLERHYQRRDGSTFWGQLNGRRIEDDSGGTVALLGVITDITPLRQAIEEVKQAKDYFFSILNTIADPVFVKDEHYRLVLVNDAACRMLGRDRSELLGRVDDEFFSCEQVEVFRHYDNLVLQSGDTQINQQELTDASGRLRTLLSHKSCYIDQAGRRLIVGILRDITEQKELEHQTTRAAQLAAVGELASGVAHEINNPITGVINCAQLLLNRRSVAEPDRPILERIIKDGERIAAIVHSLLFFARDSGSEAVDIHIQELLAEVLLLVHNQLKHDGIELQLDLPERPLRIHANPQQIEQVILNLVSNARHALNERNSRDQRPMTLRVAAEDALTTNGRVCRMIVYDNGVGIPVALLDRLGQPFVTTKPAGVGTGLGLSISHEIVKRFAGELRITSQEGLFTEVTVEFPAV